MTKKAARQQARAQREKENLQAAMASPGGISGTADVRVLTGSQAQAPTSKTHNPAPPPGVPGMPQGHAGVPGAPQGRPGGGGVIQGRGPGGGVQAEVRVVASPAGQPRSPGAAEVRVVTPGTPTRNANVSMPRQNVTPARTPAIQGVPRPGNVNVVSGGTQNVRVQSRIGNAQVVPAVGGQRRQMQPPTQVAVPPRVQPPNPQEQQLRGDVTVILSCYERPNLLMQQIEALRAQTIAPAFITVWLFDGNVPHSPNIDQMLKSVGVLVIRSAMLGPWMRFQMAATVSTTYVCILDDDTIPGPQWIQACLERMEAGDDVCIAASGEVFLSDDANNSYLVGPESPSEDEIDVDVGRQGWFLDKDFFRSFLLLDKHEDDSIGWDIHLAAMLQLRHAVMTVVLPYTPGNTGAWGMTQPTVQTPSVSARLKAAADRGAGPALADLKSSVYSVYRTQGWSPFVVLDSVDTDESVEAEQTELPAE